MIFQELTLSVSVDEPAIELRPSQQLLGIGLLCALVCLSLYANFFVCVFGSSAGGLQDLLFVFCFCLGLIIAEPFVLLIWLVLGDGSLGQRSILVIAISLALLASFFLGCSFYLLDVERSVVRQLSVFLTQTPVLLVLVLIWAASLPIVAYHGFFGRCFVRGAAPVVKPMITIRGLLIYTALTAVALTCAQVVAVSLPSDEVWWVASICALVTALFSALFVVTAVGRLMRDRGFWLWIWLWPLLLVSPAIFFVMFNFDNASQIWRALDDILSLALFPVTFAFVIVLFLGALRLLGYRICRP